MIADAALIDGIRIGHWTGDATGVTVIIAPAGTVGSGEVRGGAPATREFVERGGRDGWSVAAADGVMRFLAERGQGFATAGGVVPIVPTAAIFDLVESNGAAPGSDEGYAAAVAAQHGSVPARGRVGAGRGATVGKSHGRELAVAGGFGLATGSAGTVRVVAIAVVNAFGDVVGADGRVLAGSRALPGAPASPDAGFGAERANTTLVVVATDAKLDKVGCRLVAESAHDGLARAIRPAHTRFDGDLVVALATGSAVTPAADAVGDLAVLDRVRVAAADATEAAIRDAVVESGGAGDFATLPTSS